LPANLAVVAGKRGDHNRIGFALTVCYLRFPGRALGNGETSALPLTRFVARQLDAEPEAFAASDTSRASGRAVPHWAARPSSARN
jgi:hypothetical protein